VDEFNESGADKARKAAAHIGKDFLPRLTGKTQGNNWDTIGAIAVLGEMGEAGENGEIVRCIVRAGRQASLQKAHLYSSNEPSTSIENGVIRALDEIARKDFRRLRRFLWRELHALYDESEMAPVEQLSAESRESLRDFIVEIRHMLQTNEESLPPVLESFLEYLRIREDYFDLEEEEQNEKIMEFWVNSMGTHGGREGAIRSNSELIPELVRRSEDVQELKDTLVFLCLFKLFPEDELTEVSIRRMREAVEEIDSIIEMNLQRIVNELRAGTDWTCADAIASNIVSQVRRIGTAEGEMRSFRARSRIGMRKADDKNSLRAQRRAA